MKIFDLLQEAIYDIVGYILPGLIVIPFLLLIYYSKFTNSSIYYLYFSISNINDLSFPKDLLNINLSNCIPIVIAAYFLGLILKYVSLFIDNLLSYNSMKKIFKGKTLFAIYSMFRYKHNKNNITNDILKNIITSNSSILSNNYKLNQNPDFVSLFNEEDFLKEFARTTARFNKHNTLTQKYIAKTNLFSSLSSLFFIEFLSSIISMIIYLLRGIYCIYNSCFIFSIINFTAPIIISCILGILFVACYSEFKDHKNYQRSENFIYLIDTYYKKNDVSSNS